MNCHLEHILTKHPDLLTTLCIRKQTRRRKIRRKRCASIRFSNAILEALAGSTKSLFCCPDCRGLLDYPVTLECGHTFCVKCVPPPGGRCSHCGAETQNGGGGAVNVLLRELVNKLKKEECEEVSDIPSVPETTSLLGIEPRYHLRSRYAGLLSNDEAAEKDVTEAISRLLAPMRRYNPGRVSKNGVDNFKRRKKVLSVAGVKVVLNKFFEEVEFNQEESLRAKWDAITEHDLECILCSRCFLDPVTTSCGHTFCRECLTRVLDYGLSCPLCVTPLRYSEQSRGVTYALEDAIRLLIPSVLNERIVVHFEEVQTLGRKTVPVFVCTNAFPGVACPLFVHEPRYRLLTRRCLQSGRRFAMTANAGKYERFACYGTILEIRDAILLSDGRFILSTVGVRRFRVFKKGEEDGYDTASIQYFRDNPIASEKLTDLIVLHQKVHYKASKWIKSLNPTVLDEVERLLGPMPRVEKNWASLPDGPAWTWWLIPIFPLSPQLQVGFLRTTSLEKRLRAIDRMVEHMKVRMKAVERDTLNYSHSDETNDSCSSMQV